MGILSKIDAIVGREAPATAPAQDDTISGAFSQGMRQGVTSDRGQLHALAGGVGEVLGAQDFAKNQYASMRAAQQEAATQAPAVTDWHDVVNAPDIGTGLHKAGQYVAGLAGQAVPMIGLGLGAGALTAMTGGGALPALAAGTAAMAPFETGGAIEHQQADPAAVAGNSAGQRLKTAALEGTARAAAMNVVPQLMGGKLLGTGLGAASKAGILAEGIGGNALAGAGAEKISTMAEDSLNPQRDASGDNARMADAAVAGGALGLPFAGMGLAGHALHGKAAEPAGVPADAPAAAPEPVAAAPAPKGLFDKIKGAFTRDAGDDAAQKIAAGQDVIDVDALKKASPEQQVQMVEAADAQRAETAKGWFQELTQDGKLSDENKAALTQAATDFTDRANQAVIAGVKLARDGGEKAMSMATEFYNAVAKKDGGKPAEAGQPIPLKSEAGSGADKAIADVITPHVTANFPELAQDPASLQRVAAGLKTVMQRMQDTGRVDPAVAGHLQKMFGRDTANVMTQLHEQVLDSRDPDATDNYFRAVNKLDASVDVHGKLIDMMRGALPEDVRASRDQLNQMAKHLQEYVSGATLDGKTPEQSRAHARLIEGALKEHFGDKADDILEAARVSMEMEREQDTQDAERARAEGDLPDDHVDYAGNSDDGFADSTHAGVTTEQDLSREYFGGKDNSSGKPTFMPSEQLHRQLYGNEDSQAAKVMRNTAAEHADKNVSYVTAAQYALDHGAAAEDLKAMGMKGDPKDYVMVRAEGQKREGLGWRDVDRMRLDTHRFPDSQSRIESESGEHKFDALKVANFYAQHEKLPFDENDMANPYHRLRRRFVEAIGALSDHLGEPIHVQDETTTPEMAKYLQEARGVHDSTVIAYRNGKPVTWKEVREKGRVKPTEEQAQIERLHADREAAVKAGDMMHVVELDQEIDKRTGFKGDYEPTKGSKALATAARDLGAAHERLSAEAAKSVDGKPTMRMNRLQKEYREATKRYEHAHANLEAERSGGDLHETVEGTDKVSDKPRDARMMRRAEDGGMADLRGPRGERINMGSEGGNFETSRDMESANFGGASEIDPSGQVHLAAAEHGDDKLGGVFAASRNMEAGPEGNMLHADNFRPDTAFSKELPRNVVSAIDGRVNRLEQGKSAMQRALGAKGRDLLAKLGSMRQMDAAELASIVKEKDDLAAGKTINALAAKYQNIEAKPERSTFVNRVVGKGNVSDVIRAIKVSDDTRGVQRAIDALLPHQHDASARAVLQAANERIASLIEKDPDVAYSMQRVDPADASAAAARMSVKDHIEKVLGKSVDVEFAKMLHAGEFYTDKSRAMAGKMADVIRISVHALDPMSAAFHESMHAFLSQLHDAGLMDDAHPLVKAANSEHVLGQLHELLKNEPDALRQLDDQHERLAYMYQFWAADKLKLGAKPKTILGKIGEFLTKSMGLWTNDQRAEHVMQYFNTGEYAKDIGRRSAVARVLAEGTNEHVEKFKGMVKPLGRLANAVATTGDARLRGTGIKALAELADKVYSPLHGEHGDDPGYLPAARAKRGEFMNRLANSLGQLDKGVLDDTLGYLQRGERGTTMAEKTAVATVKKILRDAHDYMTKAGVQIGDLGPDYFPRVWDPQAILRNEAEFRDMLERYRVKGDFKGSTDAVLATLTRTDGADLQTPSIKPGMQASKERVLHFISGQDAAPFLNKNLYETLNSYMTQATRRAEWARRFQDDSSALHNLLHVAEQQGATKEHLQLASDYLQGVDGTLGDTIDPKLRRAFGNAIVYQNLRLLPLAIFSSMIDPLGIMVRGGTLRESFGAMKRGFAEMPKSFKKNTKADHWEDLAAHLGVIDNAVLQHNLGTSFSQGMTSNLGKKLNDTFFKYNLMEQYTKSMRVAATQSAAGFLARHADGAASPHSARWMAELGFKPGEVKVKNGQPLMTAAEFEASGMKPDAAQAAADKMTLAINKWVDGAVLRPNAAHKPVWMNDPHFAVVAHLKQFVYAFQEATLKRVANEVRHGNVGPAYALAAYVPFMLAADSVKGMIQGGGQQPDWKKGWDAADYAFYEVQRAGLFGVGQFGIDTAKDLYRGGLGIGALTGPSIEQLGEAVKTIAGPEQFKTFALNALPANTLFDAAGAATASTNAID